MSELALIFQADMRAFPPRLPDQPIFYPVLNERYAEQIARDWNTKADPFAGYVTEFDLPDDYASRFTPHVVGAAHHAELWVPADELPEFNRRLEGSIRATRAFFGPSFIGHVPDAFGLRGRDARAQIRALSTIRAYSMFDFYMETCANEMTVYLNFPFWCACSAADLEVEPVELSATVASIRNCWTMKPRPAPLIEHGERAG